MSKLKYSSLADILWGIWILNPYADSFPVSRAYDVMAKIAPEHVWGAVVLVVGWMGFIAACNDFLILQMITSVLLGFLWITLSVVFIYGSFQSTASVVYLVPMLLAFDAFIDARTQHLRNKLYDTDA